MAYQGYIDLRTKLLYDQVSHTYGLNPGNLLFESSVNGWTLRGGTGIPVRFQDMPNIDQIRKSDYSIVYAFKFKFDPLATGNTFMFTIGSTSGGGLIGLYTNSSGNIGVLEKNNLGFFNAGSGSIVYDNDSWIIIHIRRNASGLELLVNGNSIGIFNVFPLIDHNNDSYLYFHGDQVSTRKEKSSSLYWGFYKEFISDEVITNDVQIFQAEIESDQCDIESEIASCQFKPWVFSLRGKNTGTTKLKFAPDGWTKGELTYERNKTYKSVLRSFSTNELHFPKDGRDILQIEYETDGIDADVQISIIKYNTQTFNYEQYYRGKLDFTVYLIDEIFVHITAVDNSFTEKFKSRDDIELNLYSLTTINNMTIAPFIDIEDLTIELPEYNRGYLAKWVITNHEFYGTSETQVNIELKPGPSPIESFGFAQESSSVVSSEFSKDMSFLLELPPYYDEFYLKIAAPNLRAQQPTPYLPWIASLILRQYHGTTFTDMILVSNPTTGAYVDLGYDDTILISLDNKTKSIALFVSGTSPIDSVDSGGTTVNPVYVTFIPKLPLKNVKAFPIHETFFRLSQLITDKNNPFQSDYFGQTDSNPIPYATDGELLAIVNGRQIRGGVDAETNISFKETFEGVDAVIPIGLGIEGNIGSEKIRIEEEDYFYNSNIIIDFSDIVNINKISKEVIPEKHYNSVSVGYSKSDGRIFNGTTEINSTDKYGTVIESIKSELRLDSSLRGDTFGINEIRTPKEKPEDKLKEYDTWIIDLYRRGVLDFKAREQEGFLTSAGASDITFGAYNLRITPYRNLRRHFNSIRGSLFKSIGTLVRYLSSKTTATWYSKFTGEAITVWNDDDIAVSSLSESRWIPEKYIVEVPWSIDNQQALESDLNGIIKLADNMYGWILTVQTSNNDKKAELELLRVNLNVVIPI